MPRLGDLVRSGAVGTVVAAILVAAAAVPLLTGERLRADRVVEAAPSGEACWGCAPYERLASLFRVQELAAEPHIRRYERELSRRDLSAVEREAGAAGLRAAQDRLATAGEARAALDRAHGACRADEACRRGPDAFHQLTCPGAWPDDAIRERISLLAGRIYIAGSNCREMPCPSLDCAARARMQAVLGELTDTLAAVGGASARNAPEQTPGPALAEMRQSLERLPLTLSGRSEDALGAWVETARQTALLLQADDLSGAAGPDMGWRLRMAQLRFTALLADVEAAMGGDANWARIADLAGTALMEIQYLEYLIVAGEGEGTCLAVRGEDIEAMTTDLRRAAAALAVCGARAGCVETPAPVLLAALHEREPTGDGGLERFAAEAAGLIAAGLNELSLAGGDPAEITTELEQYLVGEAIRARVEPETNRCVAEPGAWIGIFTEGSEDAALERRGMSEDAEGRGALIAAPDAPGAYDVRAFAAEARGGGELARTSIVVEPAPGDCEGFTGHWQTSFGALHLVVRDGIARGSYRRSPDVAPGFLTGEVRGPVLFGAWESELGSGGARLVLDGEGGSFLGAWSHIPGRYSGTGAWNGQCVPAGAAE